MGKHQQRGKDVGRATSDTARTNRHGGPQTGTGAYAVGRKVKASEIVINGVGGRLPAWMTRRR
jgi:hypothetical protein